MIDFDATFGITVAEIVQRVSVMRIQFDRRFHDSNDILKAIQLVVGCAKIEMQIRVLRIVANPLFKHFRGFCELLLLQICQSENDVGFRLLGIQRHGSRQMIDGLRELLEPVLQDTEVEMPFEERRLQLHVE